ncbi:MAG TPA: ABC transporter permease [Anaerovoracaceae bacterium]|nr:ABC transporter permease [Anaerovoracaceae bacterium]
MRTNKIQGNLKRILSTRESILILALIAGGLAVSLYSPVFLSRPNLVSMLMSITVEGMIAIGMVMLLALGELDLSVGMTMGFIGVLTGTLLKSGFGDVPTILLALSIALVIGLINGILVTRFGLNAFITTLGMSCALQGLMLVMADGRSVTGLTSTFKQLGQGTLFGVQYPIYILIVIVIITDILMRNSRGMRQIYYIGSNAKAAKLNGINVDKVKIMCFCFCALLSGLAGILITARFGSSSVTVGASTPMDVITACIIGGASLNGGKGTVWAAVLGALFLAMLSTALNLLSVNIYWQNFATGVILIVAIFFDAVSERRKRQGVKIV